MSKPNPDQTIIAHPDATEPAVIAVTGTGPVNRTLADPAQPPALRW